MYFQGCIRQRSNSKYSFESIADANDIYVFGLLIFMNSPKFTQLLVEFVDHVHDIYLLDSIYSIKYTSKIIRIPS